MIYNNDDFHGDLCCSEGFKTSGQPKRICVLKQIDRQLSVMKRRLWVYRIDFPGALDDHIYSESSHLRKRLFDDTTETWHIYETCFEIADISILFHIIGSNTKYTQTKPRWNKLHTPETISRRCTWHRLETLAVDDARAGLVVILLGDPHRLKGRQRSQN